MKNPFKSDLEKLKKMTFKKKVEYILGYYHLQILIAAICIFLFGGLIYHAFARDKGNDAVTLCVFDGFCEDIDTTSQTLNQSFNHYTGTAENAGDSLILDESFLGLGSLTDGQEQAITLQRLIGAISIGELNLMVASHDNLVSLATFDYMEDLKTALPENTYKQLEELGALITCTVPAEISSSMREYSYVCGIDLSSIPDNALSQAGYYLPEDVSIGIAANARNMDLTLQLLNLIIEPLLEA